jgi:hypothetical protein
MVTDMASLPMVIKLSERCPAEFDLFMFTPLP